MDQATRCATACAARADPPVILIPVRKDEERIPLIRAQKVMMDTHLTDKENADAVANCDHLMAR